ncbi:energy transducer TonB [Hymenobacter sp. BRD128]|uniref:energy transducer TonB n=1 Tax=Hymenobacter sp. BRD128 TaxID=2675878 RepID=UPI001565D138|nr:energy transducer TonB [Hymenobacter sp. BRD128]QKG58047.1 energy transducer TonB [Hymenobacter sp. BRD128]
MLPTNPLLNATAPAGSHLPVALLRQYAAGTLAPAAQHRVEAHTLACPRCADILEGLLQTPPTTTDQALARLQQRLRQRVQQQAAPARQVALPRRHRWLAPQLAAAAALLLGLVAGGWWAWQQRQHAPAPVVVAAPSPRPVEPAAAPAPAGPAPVAVAPSPRRGTARRARATAAVAAGRTARHLAAAAPVAAASPASAAAPARDSAALAGIPTISPAAPTAMAAPARVSEPLAKMRAAMPPPPALPATPSGGYAALREYLKKGAADFEPESPDGTRRSGRVLVRLHLGADGKIEQAEAVRKLRPDYDAEAIRLLRAGPAWVPGISAGRRAAQVVEVPVEFE